MKRKTALLLAAILAMTGAGQAVGVSAAEFTAGEAVLSGEKFEFDAEEPVFEDGETDAVTAEASAVSNEVSKAKYYGGYVSKEVFEHWEKTDEEPEEFETTYVEADSPDAFFKALEGKNTGYCLLTLRDATGGYTDLKAPKGLKVGLVWGDRPRLKSISSDSGVVIHTYVDTPGKLEIAGTGSVAIRGCIVDGVIVGNGKDDTLVVDKADWGPSQVGGIQGVENVIFKNNSLHISGGPTEFFNISGAENKDIDLWTQGYKDANIPVFHKLHDLGMNEWGTEAAVCVAYVKDFESEDWVCIDPGAGKQVAKLDLKNDLERFDMMKRTRIMVPEGSPDYNVDLDGKTFILDSAASCRNFYIYRFRSTKNMTAKEAFDLEGYGNVPLENNQVIYQVPTVDQAHRIAAAYQSGGLGEDYYFVYLPDRAAFDKVLKIPENIKGIKYHGRLNYDETTQTMNTLPVKLSKIDVPAGKTIGLIAVKTEGGTLTITGDGNTDFKSCRLNQNITAKNVSISGTAVKSLESDALRATSENYVTEKLKFSRGGVGGTILAKAAASLEFGSIDNPKYLGKAEELQIMQETAGKKKASIYFASANVNPGVEKTPGSIGNKPITVIPFNYEKAAAAGASFVKDCFDYNYKMYSAGLYPSHFKCEYQDGDAIQLMSVNRDAAKAFPWQRVAFAYEQQKYLQARAGFGNAFPSKDWVDSKGNYLTAYGQYSGDYIKTKAYIQVVDGSSAKYHMEDASVSAIKDQTYTGKALKPSVTVKFNGKTLKYKTDYTLSYANNTKAGTATVKITGIGAYAGSIKKTFKIVYPVPAKDSKHVIGDLKYKVTVSAASGGKVMVYAPVNRNCTSIVVPHTVKIKGYTFKVTAIYNRTFKDCKNLKKVVIGSYVTAIGKEVFYGCKNLKAMTINCKSLKSVGTNSLKGIYSKAVIKVPADKYTSYKKLLSGKGQSKNVKITK